MSRVAAGLSTITVRRPLMTTSGGATAANIGIMQAARAMGRSVDLMQRIISQAQSGGSRRSPNGLSLKTAYQHDWVRDIEVVNNNS
jgi:hypothetical protein